jgi:hypothetical protein
MIKIVVMKYIDKVKIAIVYGLVIQLVFSCAFFIKPQVTFIIKNESSKDLKLLLHEKGQIIESISIKMGEHFERTNSFRPGNMVEYTPFDGEKIDSLVILFIDGKGIIQYCNGEGLHTAITNPDCRPDKNIFDFNTGSQTKKKSADKYTKIIAFDDSDYLKASDL